ncbi:MAG: biotin--[acetyl-CoA-carboxylase] ligase [Dehalococcoidia bacterium]|nr:biotin--[acetyl-CoA-carboxylase] ligase [Dehalococcoidia bacterium]
MGRLTKISALVNIRKARVNEVKGQILNALRVCRGYLSGQTLSEQLGTSRVSIWKHMRSLKKDGYVIEASPRGYRLVSSPDLLLPYEFPDLEQRIHYFSQIGSTMDAARELAKKGAREGTLVIAEVQTRGRGRLSREWLSSQGGIYFTIILRPKMSPVYAPRVNLMAAIAVAATIRKAFGLKAELKWPNDVLIAGRKVCGILAEMDAEMDAVNFVNVGIGVNANNSVARFEKMATSLKDALGRKIRRKEFLCLLITEIERRQPLLMKADLLKEWKRLSATLNKEVRVMSLGEEVIGQAIDIDVTGALILKGKNGSLRSVFVGDCIHLRE